jgi:hypothetical protein
MYTLTRASPGVTIRISPNSVTAAYGLVFSFGATPIHRAMLSEIVSELLFLFCFAELLLRAQQ